MDFNYRRLMCAEMADQMSGVYLLYRLGFSVGVVNRWHGGF